MSKRTLRVRNALTGAVREVVLPGRPAVKKAPVKKAPVEKRAEPAKGESDGQGNG